MSTDLVLALDASAPTATIALLEGARVIDEREIAMGSRDREPLLPAIAEMLESAGRRVSDVTMLVCGAGPGGFTGLRIAAATAKGIASAMRAPLYAVSSLALVVAGRQPSPATGRYLVAQDALRGEAFTAVWEWDGHQLKNLDLVPPLTSVGLLESVAAKLDATPVGSGTSSRWMPHARGVALMLDSIVSAGPVSLERWEPDYGRVAEAQRKWEAQHGRALAP